MRALGGIPVDRRSRQDLVSQVVAELTRMKNSSWSSRPKGRVPGRPNGKRVSIKSR